MPSILLVDDESSLLEIGKIYLEKTDDFKVDTALSVTEAVDLLSSCSYDVIVSDYEMPEMNGIDLLKKIRSDGDETPFIIFTGRSREEVVIEALNAGATFYLQKGGQAKAQFSELVSKINKAVEAQKNERELRNANKFLKEVHAVVKDGISLLDIDFNIQEINPTLEKWYCSREDAIGRKCYEVYHGKDKVCDFCPCVEAIQTNGPVSRVVPGGKGRNIDRLEIFAHPVHDDRGNIIGVLEFVRDITPRLKIEEALRTVEDIYGIFLDYADEIIYSTDSNLMYDSISPSVHRISGIPPADVIGKPFIMLVHPDDVLMVQMCVDDIKETGEAANMDVRLLSPDGFKWFNTMIKPRFNDNGEFLGLIGSSKCIHDRKMAEQELRTKEEMYRLMVENSLDVIWTMNLDSEFTYLSPSLKHITGHEVADFMSSGLTNYVHPEEEGLFQRELDLLIRSDEESSVVITRVRHADKTYNWYQTIISRLNDEAGDIIGLIGISRNINNQRAAEDRYQTLFSSISEAFAIHEIILDDDGEPVDYTFLDVNPAFTLMTGLEKKDVLGKTVKQVLPATESQWIKIYGDVALNQEPAFFCSYAKDFDAFFQVYVFSPQRLKFVTIFDEITKVVENDRKLLESERRFNLAMEGTGAGLWDWNIKEGLIKQSPRSMEMIGLEAKEAEISLVDWSKLCHPDDIEKIETAVNDHYQDKNKKFTVTYRIKHTDGRWIWIKARGKLIRDINGDPMRFVGTNMDITDEMNIRESLIESNKKLQTLASVTRHDILNNLMVIEGYTELLKSGDVQDKSTLFKNIKHAAKMIESHIRFSRDYHDIGREKSTWMHLSTGICDLIDDRLVVDDRIYDYEVFTDPMLYKVFNNLYDNTQRHATMSTSILVGCKESDGCLIITYEDDGPGIPYEEKEKIFDDGYGKHSGHGMFLIKEILFFTGISIREIGIPGKGVRFEIIVPEGGWRKSLV